MRADDGSGKLVPCPANEPARAAHERKLANLAGLMAHERDLRFDDLKDRAECKDTPAMIEAARRFVDRRGRPILTIAGDPGTGKSLVGMAIVNEWGPGLAVYTPFADLLDYMRAGFADDAEIDARERYSLIKSAELVVIDDFDEDKINLTDYAVEFRYRFFDWRTRLAEADPPEGYLVIIMNGEPRRLPTWLFDRLRMFTIVLNRDPSMRPAIAAVEQMRLDGDTEPPPEWTARKDM